MNEEKTGQRKVEELAASDVNDDIGRIFVEPRRVAAAARGCQEGSCHLD